MTYGPGDPVRARLADLLAKRGLDLASVSRAIGKNQTYVQQYLKRGNPRRLPEEVREALGKFLSIDPDELRPFAERRDPTLGAPRSVPIEAVIARRGGPETAASPRRWALAPAELADPDECFAAIVGDDSADRLYPPSSMLFARRVAKIGALLPGDEVVVRRWQAHAEASEYLAGRLGWSPTGALLLFTASTNRNVAAAVTIRPERSDDERGFSPGHEEAISYAHAPDDPAEIVGVVEIAQTPRRGLRQASARARGGGDAALTEKSSP